MDNTLGKNIATLRLRCGMSQKDLGKLLNVSGQAVSRWECGGMPDAAMIPDIAKALRCSLEELYGISSNSSVSIEELMGRELFNTPPEQRTARALELAWHIIKLIGSNDIGDYSDAFFATATACENADQKPNSTPGTPTGCYVTLSNGIANASVSSKLKYVFLMGEPEDGYASLMYDMDSYRHLFSLFSKEYRLEVFLLGYCMPKGEQYTCDYVCTNLGLTKELAMSILDELSANCLLICSKLNTQNGYVECYSVSDSIAVIQALYFFKTFMRSGSRFCLNMNSRTTPLLQLSQLLQKQAGGWSPSNSRSIRHPAPASVEKYR